MTNAIAGTYVTLVTLGSAIDNPTTITQTGLLADGLQVNYHNLSVVNAGSIAAGSNLFGVAFAAGGSITNQSGGTISGNWGVFGTVVAVTVVNDGSIAGGAHGFGVRLDAGGSVTNQSAGAISGYEGIFGTDGMVAVMNAGGVSGYIDGISLDGGSVTNQSSGTISGGHYGVDDAAIVVNAGSIYGSEAVGVLLHVGGNLINQSNGTISGGYYGVEGGGTVVNAGNILGFTRAGVSFLPGGSLTNQSGGTITGAVYGVYSAYAAMTVVNAGVIVGGSDAVFLAAGYNDRLVIDPGAVFSSQVDGGNAIGATAISTLELAAGASAGTLTGLGTQFVDFAQVVVDAGARWTLTGGNTIVADVTLTDSGILTDAGTLANAGAFNGELVLAAGGVLSNTSSGTVTVPGGIAVYGAAAGGATVVNAGVIAGGGGFRFFGIDLGGGGSVTNQSGGTISGYIGVYSMPGSVTVVNDGRIAGSSAGGVYFRYGGSVTNQSGGTIIGGGAGVFGDYGGVAVVNAGGIGGSQEGVRLEFGGYIANQAGGTISGGYKGISGNVTAVTVVNAGSIVGSRDDGIYVRAGGTITNQSGGAISGRNGIESRLTDVTVVNAGDITGTAGVGVYLDRGGSVTNQGGGTISGYFGIYGEGGAVAVTNAGNIVGHRAGIYLFTAGSVTNQSGGAISGYFGVYAEYSPLTVVNAGAISGVFGAVRFAGGYTNLLVIDPGAVFSGGVVGGNAIGSAYVSTMELASAGSAGTLSGLGTQFVDFAQVTLDAGAQWTLTGSNAAASGETITNAGTLTLSDATLSGAAALINDGAIVLDPSSMTIASLTGLGSFTIEAGSTLDVTGAIASTETIIFAGAGAGASLVLGSPDNSAGPVTGFAAGDTIDLAGIDPASVSFAGGELSFAGGSFSLTTSAPLAFESDGNGGTDVVACFTAGTRIATPDGAVLVEALRTADRVLTASGGVRPVRWVGVRSIDSVRHPVPGQVQPIRIAAGAFADGVPSRDLRLSPDHAVLLHGMLIPIKLLLNGASIVRETGRRPVTYYHVELDAHDVLLAEGLAAESYLDTGNRAMFENAGLPVILHPDLANDQVRRARGSCAPFADRPEVVEPVWRTLAVRSERMGLAVPPMPETCDDPDLHLVLDGRRCAPVSVADGRYTFVVAGGSPAVRLVSRHAVRADAAPWVADGRRLGVLLSAITIRSGGEVLPIVLDHPLLSEGWWDPEWHAQTTLRRWTKGDAVIPMTEAGPVLLEVEVAATVPYLLLSADGGVEERCAISVAV